MRHKKSLDPEVRLGFTGLSALVFGMMVGAGIFNIPQNMAACAGAPAVVVSWLITAAGMLLLVATFKILSDRYPELNAGMYLYARQGFGLFPGFMTAWGYWLCTAFANVAYAVMLNDTLGAIFPSLLSHGWPTLLFGSALIWIIYLIVVAGMRTAKILNTVMSAVKIGCILLIIVLLAIHVRPEAFAAAFLDTASDGELPGLWTQVMDTMLVTLWCFIGIEGGCHDVWQGAAQPRRGPCRNHRIFHGMAAVRARVGTLFRNHGPCPSCRTRGSLCGICPPGDLWPMGLLAGYCIGGCRAGWRLGGMVAGLC